MDGQLKRIAERAGALLEDDCSPAPLYKGVRVRASRLTGLFGTRAGAVPPRDEAIGSVTRRFRLFHGKDVVLHAGDRIALHKDGREVCLIAADSVVYENHAETTAEEERAL